MPRLKEPGRFGSWGGLLGGAVLLTLIVFSTDKANVNPINLIPLCGLISALALIVARKTPPALAAGVLLLATIFSFAFADITAGCVLTAALATGLAYAVHPWRRRLREDDHFFLGSLFFWLALVALLGLAALTGNKQTLGTIGALPAKTAKEFVDSLEKAEQYFRTGEAAQLLVWTREHPLSLLMAMILPAHAFIAFIAIRWARGSLEWIHPIQDTLLLFRVDPRYSLILILSLALFVLDPYLPNAALGAIAVPPLAWFSVACALAGFSCMVFTIMTLRAANRLLASWMATAALALTIVACAIQLLVIIGMIDIWFDIRKLAPKKGEI